MSERGRLPAVAAIATVTAIATIPAITTATPSTTTARAAAAAEAAASATTATLFLRTSFVDDQVAAAKVLPVHGIDGAVSFVVIGNFDEGETARLPCETVTNEIYCGRINTSLREIVVQRVFRGRKRKIPNVKLLHLRTPFARNRTAFRGARWKAENP
jgi:hypothetical protein